MSEQQRPILPWMRKAQKSIYDNERMHRAGLGVLDKDYRAAIIAEHAPDPTRLIAAAKAALVVLEALQRMLAKEAELRGLVPGGDVDTELRAALAEWEAGR